MLVSLISRKKAEVENLADACDEVLIADEVKIVYGESFCHVDNDTAGTVLEAKTQIAKDELKALTDEKDHLDVEMKALKAQLYAKFGSQIYLENE